MKILITGTHFTPAAAVIGELKKQDAEIIYVGRNTTLEGDPSPSVESRVLPKMGVKFIPLIAGRLQRSFSPYTIPSLLKIPIGFIQALIIILIHRPDVLLSFGGYVSVPIVLSAWLFSVPIIIHEQTLVSGLANQIGYIFADKIALSFDGNINKSQKIIVTGNPIRQFGLNKPVDWEIFKTARKENLPILLIMGGNQGSHVINLAVLGCLDKLLKLSCVIHVTGNNKFRDFEKLENAKNSTKLGYRYKVTKWIGEEYGKILSKADLVVSRSGANTLTELAYFKKRGLVIPIPFLYQDEQNKNALFFEKLGLVKILPQSKLTPITLLKNVKDNLRKQDKLNQEELDRVIKPDAAKRLALETILLVRK